MTKDQWLEAMKDDDVWHAMQVEEYRAELARHPHPSDPDHPDPEEFGLDPDDLVPRMFWHRV